MSSLTPTEAYEEIQRLLEQRGLGAISFATHARKRARERRFSTRDVEQVLRTGVVSESTGNERSGNPTWRVSGTDLDGDDLTIVVALDPAWARITIVTGF